MILDLDIGNSRIKWRLSELPSRRILKAGVVADLAELSATLTSKPEVYRVRVACVRRHQLYEELVQWSNEQLGRVPEFAEVVKEFAGLEVYYQNLTRLGVDRWLAMLAVRQFDNGPFMVVDCGTALTVDLVNGQGQHQGGYIVPGFGLCLTALQEHTAIQIGEIPQKLETSPGHSTDAAVYQGVVSMLAAFVEHAAANPSTEGALIYITGGDRELFSYQLTRVGLRTKIVDGLVLDGLAAALP